MDSPQQNVTILSVTPSEENTLRIRLRIGESRHSFSVWEEDAFYEFSDDTLIFGDLCFINPGAVGLLRQVISEVFQEKTISFPIEITPLGDVTPEKWSE